MAKIHSTAQAVQVAIAEAASEGAWRRYDGPCLAKLRSVLAQSLMREHVRLCCSGTFGVELAIRSLHLAPGDEVLLAGYDYPGNLRAIQDAGAAASLYDVAPGNWVPTVQQLNAGASPKTKAVVVSHLHGSSAPMASICEWASQRGFMVIEDACQAHGAVVDGRPAGSWGNLSVLSFGGSKLIAAGRGGAVVSNDARFAQRMTVFCERGNDSFALSELQAAAILPQYQRLATDHLQRSKAARELIDSIVRFDWLQVAPMPVIEESAFYKLGLMLQNSILDRTRVQQLVAISSGATVDLASKTAIGAARAWVLHRLKAYDLEVGLGFRGFVGRSTSRCRQPVPLDSSRIAADTTLVLHHSHLLDPQSGESTVGRVAAALENLNQEIGS